MKNFSLLDYLKTEISFNYIVHDDQNSVYNEKQNRILTIMKTPRELEKLMFFGVLICLNSFLFVFTFLPLRLIYGLFQVLCRIISWQKNSMLGSHKCDLARVHQPFMYYGILLYIVTLLLVCTLVIWYIDTSQVYHLVRGQSVIKLYVIFNVLEIFDRLASSIGQDVLDSFYYVLSLKEYRKKDILPLVFYSAVAAVYIHNNYYGALTEVIHSVLILFQAVTINVAINSHSKALFTVMVSNQFVELKGSVFKKFDVKNAFQMSCSDIRERFHYIVLLLIVALRNLAQFNWNVDHLGVLLPLIFLIFLSEILVDWIKHGFITKFNGISPNEYQKYSLVLAKDMISGCGRMSQSEYSDLVSRRIGFTPLPLACILTQTVYGFVTFPGYWGKVFMILSFLCLVSVKIFIGIVILGIASNIAHSTTTLSNSLRHLSREPTPPHILTRHPKTETVANLRNVERFELVGSRIV